MLKWTNIIIKLTIVILILSTPSVVAHFINKTPIHIIHFLAYLFNILILLVSLVVRDIHINGLSLFCDKIIRWTLILLVIIVPVFFWLPLYDTFDLAKLTIMYSLDLIILCLWLIKAIAANGVKLEKTPLDIPILAFLGVHILCTLTSVSPTLSLFGFYKRYEGLLPMTNYIFLFYVIINFMNTPKLVILLIKTMIMTATVIAIYGIFQHFGLDPFHWSFSAKERVFGTFGNPVFFSAYLIMIIPLSLSILLSQEKQPRISVRKKNVKKISHKSSRKKKETKSPYQELPLIWLNLFNSWKNIYQTSFNFISPWWYRISLIILFLCFIYTRGRATTIGFGGEMFLFSLIIYGLLFSFTFYGSLIFCTLLGFVILLKWLPTTHILVLLLGGTFLGLSFFGPLLFFDQKMIIKKRLNTSIIIVLMGIVIYFNLTPENSVVNRLINTIIKTEQASITTVEEKKEITDIEARIQQALPQPEIKFTGGTEEERARLWKDTIKIIIKDWKNFLIGIGLDALQLMNIGTDKAHNDFLDITVTRGIIGLIIYLWLLITYMWVSLKAVFHQPDMNKKLLIAGFIACEVGYLIQNQFSFGLVTLLAYFWIVMGMTMVLIKQDQKLKAEEQRAKLKDQRPYLFSKIILYLLIMGITIVLICLAFRQAIADFYYRKGFDFVEKHRYGEGVPGMEKAVEVFPYENCYWKVLNSVYVERANNDPERRKMWAKKAIEGSKFLLTLIPKDTGSYFNMGMAYYLLGDTSKAISSYNKALELDPNHTDAMNNLATVYANQGQYKEAEELFKKVVKINPNHASAKNNLIQLYKIQKKYKQAAELDADYAKQMHISLAKTYYEKGNIDKAIEEIKKVIAIDPKDIQSIRNLGSFYLLKKNYKKAQIEFNKVLELDPNDNYAKQMLKNISFE